MDNIINIENNKFLVTGALGFIGSNFVNSMADKYKCSMFYILDKNDYCASTDNINKNNSNVEIIIGDIQNNILLNFILKKYNIDIIVHFAAQTHVDNSFFNSIEFTKNNVLGTHVLLESSRKYQDETKQLKKFIHVSTDEVYGEVLDGIARDEASYLDATNPYAASKIGAEAFVKSYYYSYQLPVVITRGNNVYGINQYPEKIVPKFICQLLDNKKLTIHGNGSSKRNFVHVDDVVDAFEIIITKGEIGQIYNISANTDNEYCVLDIAKILLKLVYPSFDESNQEHLDKYLLYVEDRKFNDHRYLISNDKLKKLGWDPKRTNFIENIKNLIEWYKINRHRYYSDTNTLTTF